jgi:cytochrome c oxidase cbb3-type subunit 1
MWRAYDKLGFLQYSFAETVAAMHPYYVIRATGGVLFLTGALLMVYNIVKTVRSGEPVNEPVAAPLGTTAARVQAAE